MSTPECLSVANPLTMILMVKTENTYIFGLSI